MDTLFLRHLQTSLQAVPVGTLSDTGLAAASRMALSVHNLVAVNALEADFGSLRSHRAYIGRLYRECLSRCRNRLRQLKRTSAGCVDDCLSCSRLAVNLFSLVHTPALTFYDNSEEEACLEVADELLDFVASAFSDAIVAGGKLSEKDDSDLLRCIVCYLYMQAGSDEQERLWSDWLSARMSAFAAGWSADGYWPHLPVGEALERLDVMNRASYILMNREYDALVSCSCRYYAHQVLAVQQALRKSMLSAGSLRSLGLLYELLGGGNACCRNFEQAVAISSALHRWATDRFVAWSDEWFIALSYAVDGFCEQISAEIQQEVEEVME